MPTKKAKYSYPIQFFPRSKNDILKDDPTESQNVIVPLEPEHFKYGVYFNDGYNYMNHLVSLEEFNDQDVDLREIVKQNERTCSMLPSQSIKSATVLNEFAMDNEGDGNNLLEKIKEVARDEIDEDILNGLESDAELSELEDDFIEIADTVNEKPVITGDKGIFNQFFGNQMENDEDDEVENSDKFSDFVNNIRKPINDISQQSTFDQTYNEFKQFRMPSTTENSSKRSMLSKSFMYAFERDKFKENNKESNKPVDISMLFYQYLDKGETEYDEEEVDKAVDEWVHGKPAVTSSAFDVTDKKSKHQPKLITIEKSKRKRKNESMDVEEEGEEEEELVFTDVSQFHVPRPPKETAEEKRERKKSIKLAKHARKDEKKKSRETFKHVKSMI